jgi:hypothetical protein
MRNRIAFPAIGAGIFAGLLGGVWADWPSRVAATSSTTYVFQAEPYGQSNLVVDAGDLLLLQHPNQSTAGMHFKFDGNPPCSAGGNGSSFCVVSASATGGEVNFSCFSDDVNGDSCPDPGLQQRSTNPINLSGWKFLRAALFDFTHLIGWDPTEWRIQQARSPSYQSTAPPVAPPSGTAVAKPAAPSPVGAYANVVCNGSATLVLNRSVTGNPKWPSSVLAGKRFFWSANDVLTLSNTGFCASALASGAGNTTSCTVGTTPGDYTYKASLQSCSTADSEKITVIAAN